MGDFAANIPEVVEEVRQLFERYERALTDKNVEVLDDTFWNSPHTIRYAPGEHGYGFDEIHEHRVARAPGPGLKEKRIRLEILTLGRNFRDHESGVQGARAGAHRPPEPDLGSLSRFGLEGGRRPRLDHRRQGLVVRGGPSIARR